MSEFGDTPTLVPDLVEPVTGFRVWSVDEDGALMGRGPWVPGEDETAVCAHHGHRGWMSLGYGYTEPPQRPPCTTCPSPTSEGHDGYGCGLYAYKDLTSCHVGDGGVMGEVQMWGTVYEHENGWRAEHARVIRLFRHEGCDEAALQRTADIYVVPLEDHPLDPADVKRERIRKRAEMWRAEQESLARYQASKAITQATGQVTSGEYRAMRLALMSPPTAPITKEDVAALAEPRKKRTPLWAQASRNYAVIWTVLAGIYLAIGWTVAAVAVEATAVVAFVAWLVGRRRG